MPLKLMRRKGYNDSLSGNRSSSVLVGAGVSNNLLCEAALYIKCLQ